jgi:hypothetical protein
LLDKVSSIDSWSLPRIQRSSLVSLSLQLQIFICQISDNYVRSAIIVRFSIHVLTFTRPIAPSHLDASPWTLINYLFVLDLTLAIGS